MKMNTISKRVMGAVFGFSLLLGIGIASASNVQAQYQNPYWRQEQMRQEQMRQEQIRRQREWERQQRRQQQAQRDWRYDDNRYGYGYESNQLRQTALNAGYNEGIKEGRKDRNNRDRFDYRDEEDYRNANTDYSSRLGNKDLYRQYFRQGFVNGYTDGYRGY